MTWQPIETAPKDGTWILVYEAGEYEPRHYVVQWGPPQWQLSDQPVPDTWVTDAIGPNPDTRNVEDATHWMPLPTPPE